MSFAPAIAADIVSNHDARNAAAAQNSGVLRVKTGAPQRAVQNAKPIRLLLLLTLLAIAHPAAAQLPTAAGKQIVMSNPAWKIFIPSTYQQRPGNVADLLVHFHGDPQTYWNNAKYADLNSIIVTVNYSGFSSVYTGPFSANTSLFQNIINEALTKVRAEANIPDTLAWDKLGVSSFSAGYGAVREILKSATYRNDIDALLAADSLYATTAGDDTPLDSQMVDYKTFASLAKNGQKTFIYTHSEVPTYTYENTAECGDELMQSLGIAPTAVNESGLGTLDFYRKAQSGNFQLWGGSGSDAAAHSKHLQYIGEFLEDLPLAKLTAQEPQPADFNDDGQVNGADLASWRNVFGTRQNAPGDANADGHADGTDFLIWQQQVTSAAAQVVPEPTSLALVLATLAVATAAGSAPVRGQQACRR